MLTRQREVWPSFEASLQIAKEQGVSLFLIAELGIAVKPKLSALLALHRGGILHWVSGGVEFYL